ncbi:hypothetical protein Cch01nite_24750 [Cellulomonas chitinilytica]|uniref:Uncharacterized protein n=1 Tax=Cellulomonas chitinilytica TaxID=398759 RepID=A0A919P514_9CELL|nr:hypothetical protein [Cellulomonas chitinilytica]GIG21751.1 hypothetical protein Cch01nite_24750 [Cellulomonas chitinilytica]
MSNEEQGTPPPQTVPDWARRIVPGTFDRRVLQHTFWLSVRGEVQALDELSTSDLLCIVDGLGKQAVWLYGCELIDTYIGLRIAHEQGHASREELLADLGLPTIVDLSASEWLETTTLIRAVRRHLQDRE